MKIYRRSDILEKISHKVKTVEDLYNLPVSDFDPDACDCWYDEYLHDSEYQARQFIVNSNCLEMFFSAFYLMEVRPECHYLVLLEFDDCLYFIFSPTGAALVKDIFTSRRDDHLRLVCDMTYCIDGLENLLT